MFDGSRLLPATDVLVSGDRILAIGKGLTLPAGIEVVSGTGRTLLPGLIDAHAHVYDVGQLEQSLAFGVTTVLDMFSVPAMVRTLRSDAAVHADRADLRSAGTLATAPGGHGTEYGIAIPTVSAPGEAQAFVDARLAEGSDYIKIVYDNGSAYGRSIPTVSEETLGALVVAAHARRKLAVVHIGTYAEARAALTAGADGLVHLFRDQLPADDFGKLAARHKAFVTPTLAVLRTLHGGKSALADDPAILPLLSAQAKGNLAASFTLRASETPGSTVRAIAELRAAKVPILCGTDAPNPGTTFGASVHDELALLVEAGLTPTEALAGATSLPAERFGLADRGRIAAGQRADLVLVEGEPATTITDSRKIVGIWRGGVKFDRAAFQVRVSAATAAAAFQGAPAAARGISDFEDGTASVRFGQAWSVSTDAMIGGKSTVALAVVDAATGGGAKALEIRGEVASGGPSTWAGAIFSPGERAFTPVDLSTKAGFRFRAQADGADYVVMVFAQKRGRMPLVRTFSAPAEASTVSFAWSDFESYAGDDVLAIFIGRSVAGPFRLLVDDVELVEKP